MLCLYESILNCSSFKKQSYLFLFYSAAVRGLDIISVSKHQLLLMLTFSALIFLFFETFRPKNENGLFTYSFSNYLIRLGGL